MNSAGDAPRYGWHDTALSCSHDYLLPVLVERLPLLLPEPREERRLFDLGCGNGSVARYLHERGWSVTGVDPSEDGIALANAAYPDLDLRVGSAYDDLAAQYGRFPIVISLEVVEHLYSPRRFAETLFQLVAPGGPAVVSTPYHGYLKNLLLAVSGGVDKHFSPLWDHGHIKFWSKRTLSILLQEAGFTNLRFLRVGRVPPVAKSMIAIAEKA